MCIVVYFYKTNSVVIITITPETFFMCVIIYINFVYSLRVFYFLNARSITYKYNMIDKVMRGVLYKRIKNATRAL